MPDKQDSTKRTMETYDQSAASFADNFWRASLEQVWNTFSEMMPPGGMILDLGCGAGRDVARFNQGGFLAIGADLSMGLLKEAHSRTGGEFVQSDMRAIPFGSAQFDGVWVCASLLHIPRPHAPNVLAQTFRVMGLGSIIYIAVKQGDGEDWEEREGPRFFVFYQEDELVEMIRATGFSMETSWITEAGGQPWINVIARK